MISWKVELQRKPLTISLSLDLLLYQVENHISTDPMFHLPFQVRMPRPFATELK